MSNPPSQRFGQVHITKKSKLGGTLGSVVAVALFLGAMGFGYHFWTDEAGLVRHLTERDGLAVASAYALSLKEPVPPASVDALRQGLETGDVPLKRACARALGATRDPENTAFLGDAALHDTDVRVRVAALDGLAANGDVHVSRFLDSCLREEEPNEVKIAACGVVGDLKLERYLPRLIDLVLHPVPDVQRGAVSNLDKFVPDGAGFGLKHDEWKRWHDQR